MGLKNTPADTTDSTTENRTRTTAVRAIADAEQGFTQWEEDSRDLRELSGAEVEETLVKTPTNRRYQQLHKSHDHETHTRGLQGNHMSQSPGKQHGM